MEWYSLIFELIDPRSFSNLWYWIALAVLWSTLSHWVVGVPLDLIHRARREQGEARRDMELLVGVYTRRIRYIVDTSGLWLAGFGCFMLTSLLVLGFWYRIEFARALFMLLLPTSFVMLLTFRTARLIETRAETGEVLDRRLMRHRMVVQVIGMLAILVTAMYGMWQNMQIGVLG